MKQDPDFETEFYENILAEKPNHREALTLLAEIYTARGDYQKGFEMDRRLADVNPQDETVQYNLACSYALLNQKEKAVQTLKKAIDLGYSDFAHLVKDTDFKNLKDEPEFKKIIASVKTFHGEDGNE